MVLSESTDDELYRMHQDLCSKLNSDSRIITNSWETFESINKKFVLEGDKLHWLGCAIYVASMSIEVPTVDTSSVVKGMGISLTTLLRHSNLSFLQFFSNIMRWADMAQLPDDFRNKITHLRSNFSVAYNTFKKYQPLFAEVFLCPAFNSLDSEATKHRNRKNRSIPCTPIKIFEFIWNMFITIKAEETACSVELVKSHHLLYCCIDLAFKNIFIAERRELLNTAVLDELEKITPEIRNETPCIVKKFCKCEPIITEALHMKVYIFKQIISKLIEQKVLIADENEFTGIFDSENFDQNFRNFTKAYETHLLSHGDFDERIFLAEHKRLLMEKEQAAQSWASMKALPQSDSSETSVLDSPRVGSVTPGTPLTARKYLGPRENDVPDKSTVEKISRLHSLINDRNPNPSVTLKTLFETCGQDPLQMIQKVISVMVEKFINGYVALSFTVEDAQNKIDLAVTLFYKYIELIFIKENSISTDISAVVEKPIFYQCTFACCLEVVLYCYNFPKKFPWLLEVLELEPIQFVKVIELIVRCKDNLSRELIKHLNRIEETVMESLAWKSNSSIWQAIENSGQPIPKYEEIALPSRLYNDESNERGVQSPGGPSAMDCFQSPLSQVCKNLFPSSGQSLLQKHTHIMIPIKDGNIKLIPIVETEKKIENQQGSPALKNDSHTTSHPRRTGSLAIIFRKFYNLANIRMQELCSNLSFVNFELKRKIWTIFEDSIRHTDLIKDRHLDQLLMCSIYVICRACNATKIQDLFSVIMKFYRQQPQASSTVYRDVLIEKKAEGDDRKDLITFYNNVYIKAIQTYAKKFQPNVDLNTNIELSPLPASTKNLMSPNIQVFGNVIVRPLEASNTQIGSSFNYYFSRSPSKDLKNINRAINNNGVQGKRLLVEEEGDTRSSKRISNRKIQSLVEDRMRQNAE